MPDTPHPFTLSANRLPEIDSRRLLPLLPPVSLKFAQSVACNGLHSLLKRCCRWILVPHDRVACDVLPLTQEFLGMMPGVRRSGVNEVLQSLQEEGLVRIRRAGITVLDRAGLEAASCECYRAVRKQFDRLLG